METTCLSISLSKILLTKGNPYLRLSWSVVLWRKASILVIIQVDVEHHRADHDLVRHPPGLLAEPHPNLGRGAGVRHPAAAAPAPCLLIRRGQL